MNKSLGTNLHFWRFCAHARREYNFACLTSPPNPHTMLKTSTCNFTWFSTLCWVVRGNSIAFLKDIAAFFSKFSSKTQIIRYMLQVSQRLLSTIVPFKLEFKYILFHKPAFRQLIHSPYKNTKWWKSGESVLPQNNRKCYSSYLDHCLIQSAIWQGCIRFPDSSLYWC